MSDKCVGVTLKQSHGSKTTRLIFKLFLEGFCGAISDEWPDSRSRERGRGWGGGACLVLYLTRGRG